MSGFAFVHPTPPQPQRVASIAGFDVYLNPSLPRGVVELRDKNGNTLCSMVNVETIHAGNKE